MNGETLILIIVRAAWRRGWTFQQIYAMIKRMEGYPYYDLDAPPVPGSGWAITAWLSPNIWRYWDPATGAPFTGSQNFRVVQRTETAV